ncbi:MAG: hypothetical protein EA384_13925 [Spirochaetaceae bacterium]|nr:MAG: hypothetical protein EA384_13925 [Spirochaetaceae bacterium]
MAAGQENLPTVLVPYCGPEPDSDIEDIFVYMRPETNGVLGESTILRVIERCPEYRVDIRLVYLANLPGDFILSHHIIERHYATRLHFAVLGKSACTPGMRREFETHFGEPFDGAPIVGSFEALRLLQLSPDELFNTWVDLKELLFVSGQTIKKIRGYFVMNYDLPALLHKNNRSTDIAVMVFRTRTGYEYFAGLVERMRKSLIAEGLIRPHFHTGRAFHYSKSPFEQILDGLGYLYARGAAQVPLEQVSFCSYLLDRGVSMPVILGAVRNPVALFGLEDGSVLEENLMSYTFHDSYDLAYRKFCSMTAQYLTDR